MIEPVGFEIYCYAPPELLNTHAGAFPCGRCGITEFCLRNGRCPYASAVPVSLMYIAKRDVSIMSLIGAKAAYWFDQIYRIIKWKLIKGSALKDLEDINEDLEKKPAFLIWATISNVQPFQFYQWLGKVKSDEAELSEEPIEGTSDDVETPVESKEV